MERYLGGRKGVPTMDRMKAINLIRDLTASDFGGYHELLAIHAEGSLEAQKITIFRGYDCCGAWISRRRPRGSSSAASSEFDVRQSKTTIDSDLNQRKSRWVPVKARSS